MSDISKYQNMFNNPEDLHLILSLLAGGTGLSITFVSLLWKIADTKRKLENEFQESQKNIEISRLQLNSVTKEYYQQLSDLVNDLGSQVDRNTGAVEAFKAMRSNSTVLEKK